jgi:hypothetical protein
MHAFVAIGTSDGVRITHAVPFTLQIARYARFYDLAATEREAAAHGCRSTLLQFQAGEAAPPALTSLSMSP